MSEFDGGGSDPVLLAEMAAYFVEFDALATEEEKRALQRDWLLTHGGRLEWRPGWVSREIVGGLYPVRVE